MNNNIAKLVFMRCLYYLPTYNGKPQPNLSPAASLETYAN